MSAGEWNDAYCDIQQGYICEVNAETSYPTQVGKTFLMIFLKNYLLAFSPLVCTRLGCSAH
jgi:hypothetical protein